METQITSDDKVSYAYNLVKEHLGEEWSFKFMSYKTCYGYCDHVNKIIAMNIYHMTTSNREVLKNTLLHEIAHAIVGPSHKHDKVWREKFIELGKLRGSSNG